MKFCDLPGPPADPVDRPWVMSAPVISTRHFSKADADWLYDARHAFLRDREGTTTLLIIEDWDAEVSPGLSPEAVALIGRICVLGYRYLRLNPAGTTFNDLPTYD